VDWCKALADGGAPRTLFKQKDATKVKEMKPYPTANDPKGKKAAKVGRCSLTPG